jgi:hypothetical protein
MLLVITVCTVVLYDWGEKEGWRLISINYETKYTQFYKKELLIYETSHK